MRVITLHEPDPTRHSTLTGQTRNDEAVTEVIDFLSDNLIR